jgi:1-deoxy-D-xylulose-5-phosphate reductoisomerase
MGGTAPAVLNAANEVAVELFLAGKIPFLAIAAFIAEALENHTPVPDPSLDDLLRTDAEIRTAIAATAHD